MENQNRSHSPKDKYASPDTERTRPESQVFMLNTRYMLSAPRNISNNIGPGTMRNRDSRSMTASAIMVIGQAAITI